MARVGYRGRRAARPAILHAKLGWAIPDFRTSGLSGSPGMTPKQSHLLVAHGDAA